MAVIQVDRRGGGKLPRGPHRLAASDVAADQRGRLTDAMVDLVGEQGYAATTVAQLIDRAQISRKTFYEHYDSREQLLLAAFDNATATTLEQVREAAQRTGGSTRRLEAAMRKLARCAREQPGAIALATTDIAALDPEGLRRREVLMGEYGELIACCMVSDKQKAKLPSALAPILAGAIHRVIDSRVRGNRSDGNGRDLSAIALELARWVRSYHPAPASFAAHPPATGAEASSCGNGHLGGRAPGTLTLAPHDYVSVLERPSAAQRAHVNRERILDAVAQLTSEHGYTTLTAAAIVDTADLPERAFLAQFKNKDDAFAIAVELGHTKAQAIVARARDQTRSWPAGVSTAIYGLLDFLASEPLYAQLALISAPLAGAQMARRTHEQVAAYARLLFHGAPQRRRPPALAAEAIVQSIFELAFTYAAAGRASELTGAREQAVYLALAPYLGVTEAAKAIA
jgi:AcrR family transcriptional regulator